MKSYLSFKTIALQTRPTNAIIRKKEWCMTFSLQRIFSVLGLLLFATLLCFIPPPCDITHQAWMLFAIFLTTILSILLNILPIITASIIALAISVLTGVMDPVHAYAGFSESFILLIVAAF